MTCSASRDARLAELPEALHLVVVSFCDLVSLLQLEAASSEWLRLSRDPGTKVWDARLSSQARAMLHLGFDARQLCISFMQQKPCPRTVEFPLSDFLQEHAHGMLAAMTAWYEAVVVADPPVVILTVGDHAMVMPWGDDDESVASPYAHPTLVWAPAPGSIIFDNRFDQESAGHQWHRNEDNHLRLNVSCHAVVSIGGKLLVRTLWEYAAVPGTVEVVTAGADFGEKGGDGLFMHNGVLTYDHGELIIESRHPMGEGKAYLGCYLRMRPIAGLPTVPPVRGSDTQMQPKLSLHLANLSFGLAGNDDETVLDILSMQKLLYAAVMQDTVQPAANFCRNAVFRQLASCWAA